MPLGSGIVPEHSRLGVDIHHTSLRKACASSCTSPSTAESGLILQPYRARRSQFPDLLVPALDLLEVDVLISKQCEINFRVESVDADDFYSHGVAEAKFAAVAASLNDVFLLVIVIVVVR